MQALPTNELVSTHMWIVERFQARYQQSAPHADLRAAGALGLCEAAQKFQPARGHKFSTYAWNWVKGYVLGELRKSHVVPVPEWTVRKASKEGETVRGVVVYCLNEAMIGHGKVRDSRKTEAVDGEHLAEVTGAHDVDLAQEEHADRRMRLRALNCAIVALADKNHRHVVNRTLAGRTIAEIAKGMGFSQERVRQLLHEAQGLLAEEMRDG